LQTACPHCDHIINIPKLLPKQVAHCPYCKTVVREGIASRNQLVVAISISAIVMLMCSLFFPFIAIAKQGFSQAITLLQAAEILLAFEEPALAAIFNITTIGVPLLLLLILIPLHSQLLPKLPRFISKKLIKFAFALQPWVMSEIFLIAVLVSMVKITSMADVVMGLSFWSFCVFVVLFVYCISLIDKHSLWNSLQHADDFRLEITERRAIDQDLNACSHCHILTDLAVCPRCDSKVLSRTPHSLQNVIALLLTAIIMYFPANMLPILKSETFYRETASTIMGGVIILWKQQSYPIASIIFIASIVVPLAKIIVLAWLAMVVKGWAPVVKVGHTKLYRLVEFIGKWSMLDVFVVAISVALVQLGQLMTVTPGAGALFFTGVVITSMLAAQQFDPRLLWDTHYKNQQLNKESIS